MKKYAILLFSAIFMFALATNAQDQTPTKKVKGPSIEVRVEKMATDLGLTDAVKTSVKALLEKQAAEKKKFNAENDKESAEYKAKLKELQKAQNAEMKALIGEDNYKKLQEIKAAEKKAEQKPE
jgi:Skp family chaperone for outer membrane proteins